jgi:hypothetical protein
MTKALGGGLAGGGLLRGGLAGGGLLIGGGLVLLAAGCGASQPSGAASPVPPASTAPPASAAAPASAATTQLSRDQKALAAQYLTIARPANHRLDAENDGYGDHEKDDLPAAKRDLRAELATERLFDRQLLQIKFPPQIAPTARALVRSNLVRIALTTSQAQSTSLPRLRSFDRRHKAADAALEDQVRIIRRQLGLPPPATS